MNELTKMIEIESELTSNTSNRCLCLGGCGGSAQSCGYGYRDYRTGEFDCFASDVEEVLCEDCHYIMCDKCRKEWEAEKDER